MNGNDRKEHCLGPILFSFTCRLSPPPLHTQVKLGSKLVNWDYNVVPRWSRWGCRTILGVVMTVSIGGFRPLCCCGGPVMVASLANNWASFRGTEWGWTCCCCCLVIVVVLLLVMHSKVILTHYSRLYLSPLPSPSPPVTMSVTSRRNTWPSKPAHTFAGKFTSRCMGGLRTGWPSTRTLS
jgi:hypothetical protein